MCCVASRALPPFEWFSRRKGDKNINKALCAQLFLSWVHTSLLLLMCFSDFNFNWNTSEYANRLAWLISFLSINKWVNGGYWAKPKCCVSACAGARAHERQAKTQPKKSHTHIDGKCKWFALFFTFIRCYLCVCDRLSFRTKYRLYRMYMSSIPSYHHLV